MSDTPALAGLHEHVARNLRGVVDGCGIGHRGNGGKTAGGRGREPAQDRLLLRKAGVAEMHVRVDQTGHDPPSGAIDRFGVRERSETARPRTTSDSSVD